MTSYERIKNMVEGKPIDRVGLSAWYHMPLLDHNVTDFSNGIINSVRIMHWDIAKLQYHSQFINAAFGQEYEASTSATLLCGPVTRYAVYHPHDFRDLKAPSMSAPSIQRQLEITKRVQDKLQGQVPILATVFSPMYVAKDMYLGHIGRAPIQKALMYNAEDVHKGLEIISETTMNFMEELKKLGVDGIFYADQFASYDDLDKDYYKEFCARYDLPILEMTKNSSMWFNMLHVHGYKNLRFDQYEELGYQVQAYNWEDRFGDSTHAPTPLKAVRAMTDKILMGGVEFWHDFNSETNDRDAVKALIKERFIDALEQLGPDDQKFIFTPGCSVKMHVPEYRMQLMYEVVKEVTGVE